MKPLHRSRGATTRLVAFVALLGASLGSCASDVAFYDKEAFSDPAMDLSDDPLEVHWYSKVYYSMEGSIGGIGTSGGGGCGCY